MKLLELFDACLSGIVIVVWGFTSCLMFFLLAIVTFREQLVLVFLFVSVTLFFFLRWWYKISKELFWYKSWKEYNS